MTRTAEPLATGPFHGFFPDGAVLYRLDPPVVAGGHSRRHGIQSQEVSHIIVTTLDDDELGLGPATTVIAADEDGVVDTEFFLKFGCIVDLSVNDADAALSRLGYARG
jgi:hypothetical protein